MVGRSVGRCVGLNVMVGPGVGWNETVGSNEIVGVADGAGVGAMVQSFSYQVSLLVSAATTSRSPSASMSSAVMVVMTSSASLSTVKPSFLKALPSPSPSLRAPPALSHQTISSSTAPTKSRSPSPSTSNNSTDDTFPVAYFLSSHVLPSPATFSYTTISFLFFCGSAQSTSTSSSPSRSAATTHIASLRPLSMLISEPQIV
mmetsp:Transcript_9506/g.27890  ORF Transcript_9506/g.27890 Transcript_9506/m.27890 type:complete len:202 (+) Transcript_9506:1711-2316(+)